MHKVITPFHEFLHFLLLRVELWRCGACGLELDNLEQMSSHIATGMDNYTFVFISINDNFILIFF